MVSQLQFCFGAGPLLCLTLFKLFLFKTICLFCFWIVVIFLLFVFNRFFDGFTITVLLWCRSTIMSNFFQTGFFKTIFFVLFLNCDYTWAFCFSLVLWWIHKYNFVFVQVRYCVQLFSNRFSLKLYVCFVFELWLYFCFWFLISSLMDSQLQFCFCAGPLLCLTIFKLFFFKAIFLFCFWIVIILLLLVFN